MKTAIAAALFTTTVAAQAQPYETYQISVPCFTVNQIAKLVENKTYRIARYYDADFMDGSGHMAEMIDVKDGQIIWFAIEGKKACLVAVAEATKDDLKRAGLR
jgi:hypothetical protein